MNSIADYVSAVPLLVVYGFYLSRINPYYVLAYGVLFVVFNVPYIVMLILVALEVYDGKLSIGFLIMTNSLLNCILDTYGQIQDDILENRTNSRTVENYCDILNYEEYGETKETCVKGEIGIRIPGYRYPQSNHVALKDVSLTLKEHEKLMIVGMAFLQKKKAKQCLPNLRKSRFLSFRGHIISF